MFPSEQLWAQALSDFVDYGPYASNAITSPIEGAVYFIPRVSFEKSRIRAARENRDSSTFCPLARLTYYVIKLLRYSNFLNELELQTRHALFLYLPQAVQLLDNKLNDPDSNEAWSDLSPAVESEIAEHVSEGRVLIKRWILEQAEAGSPDAVTIESCWLEQLENLGSISASTYNRGIVSVNVMSECISVAGVFKYSTMWESRLKTVRSSPNLVQSACLVVLCKDWLASSPLGQRLCNELIAGSMDSYESDQESGEPLSFLLMCLILIVVTSDPPTVLIQSSGVRERCESAHDSAAPASHACETLTRRPTCPLRSSGPVC